MMKRTLLAISALVFAQFAMAANTNIQNNDSNLTTRLKLNELLGQVHNVKQPPYNAAGDGSTDDHTAFQNAVNDACADGAPVYVPAHTYQINSTVFLCHGLRMFGANRVGSVLQGNFAGFILGYTDIEPGYCCITVGIESIGVKNYSNDWASGAILFDNMNPGSYIHDCAVAGMTGIDARWNMFTAHISDCDILTLQASGYPRQVAIYASQVNISNIKMGGWDTGISIVGPGGTISGVAIETGNTGIAIGLERPAIFTGSISGDTLTITQWYIGHKFDFWGPLIVTAPYLICPFQQPCGGAQITTQLTNTNSQGQSGKEGTYTLSANLGTISSQRMGADFTPLQADGVTINSVQTERVNTSLYIRNMQHTQINSSLFTGTVGVGISVDTASWSSASGGTITYTLNYPAPGWVTGAQDCSMDGFANTSYNQGYHITCNWNVGGDPRKVTVTGVSNPGTWVAGYATIAPSQYACILAEWGSIGRSTIANTGCGVQVHSGGASLDLSNPYVGIELMIVNSSLGSIATASNNIAGIRIVNSTPTWNDVGMTFNMLPGVSANPSAPVQGDLYYIVDSNQSTIGGTVGGGGSVKGYVVWNGLAWTQMSK